ncbi:RecB family exonuclease [Oceanobacillus damuensis]|uniref:RecB family exonuclease n=1 Tax=Oceanobacillus damuensis TaxID=937928 RepID=UPI000A872ABB|nr:PD-(D/E)XK nuclease family protein [Oceanobacillus damuensis]
MIFSFSRLNLYEQCPYRFYNKYVLGKEEPITQPLALGKAVHKAIEDKIKGIAHDEALLNGYLEAGFHEGISQKEISDLVKRAPIQPNMGETEIYFKLPLSDEKDSPVIQGFIDLYQPDGSIIDWKTNRLPYDVLESKQIALYSWAISQLKGTDSIKGSYYFLRFGKESSHLFTHEDMEKARKWAIKVAKEIYEKLELLDILPDEIEKLFPVQPSRLCSHCPFAWECIKNNCLQTPHGI